MMRLFLAGAAWLLAVSTLACSALRAPLTPPERGGPPWLELTSPHFVVKTDVDIHTAREIAAELERSHAALAYAIRPPPRERETPVEVVVFERASDFREVAPQAARAFFSPQLAADFEPQPIIVLRYSELFQETRFVVQHELAHRFLHERFANMPRWLDEGLAQYYAPAHFREGRLVLGSATSTDFSDRPFGWFAWMDGFEQYEVPLHEAPKLLQLIDADRSEFYGTGDDSLKKGVPSSALYAAAWRLVHLLMNGPIPVYRTRFLAFLDDVQRGERPRDAFLARFGDDWTGLKDAYQAYLTVDRLQLQIAQPPPMPAAAPATERKLPARDIHLLWARVMSSRKDKQTRVQEELEAANAAERDAPDVLLRRARMALRHKEIAAAQRDLDTALANGPDDPRVLLAQLVCRELASSAAILRGASGPLYDAEYKAILAALARRATTAHQLDVVAWAYRAQGRADEALRFATRALRADPLCWGCHDTHAMILLQKGKVDEAMAASNRALGLAPEQASISGLLDHRKAILRARSERVSRP